eukprot:815547-Pelagomonas_calceolata.AAC.7
MELKNPLFHSQDNPPPKSESEEQTQPDQSCRVTAVLGHRCMRFIWGDLQSDCLADRPVTAPRQST